MESRPQGVPARVLHDLTHGSAGVRKRAAAWYVLAVGDGRHAPLEAELRALAPYLVPIVEDARFPRRPAGWLAALVAWASVDTALLLGRARDVEALGRLQWAMYYATAAEALAPDHALTILARAATLVAQGRPDDACALLSLAPGELHGHAAALALRAFAELRAGHLDAAHRSLRRAERVQARLGLDVGLVREARRELDAAARAPAPPGGG